MVPRDDLAMAFLEKTEHTSQCPWKGQASYFSIAAKSGLIENAGWSYETPKDDVAAIRNHIAFGGERGDRGKTLNTRDFTLRVFLGGGFGEGAAVCSKCVHMIDNAAINPRPHRGHNSARE